MTISTIAVLSMSLINVLIYSARLIDAILTQDIVWLSISPFVIVFFVCLSIANVYSGNRIKIVNQSKQRVDKIYYNEDF